jgi:hypothetical protein
VKQKAIKAHLDRLSRDEEIRAASLAELVEVNAAAAAALEAEVAETSRSRIEFSDAQRAGGLLGGTVLRLLRGETLTAVLKGDLKEKEKSDASEVAARSDSTLNNTDKETAQPVTEYADVLCRHAARVSSDFPGRINKPQGAVAVTYSARTQCHLVYYYTLKLVIRHHSIMSILLNCACNLAYVLLCTLAMFVSWPLFFI